MAHAIADISVPYRGRRALKPALTLLVAALVIAGPAAHVRDAAPIDRFTANALNIGGDANRPAAALVQIDIDRWSDADDRARLVGLLAGNEQSRAVKALTGMTRAGTIRTPEFGADPIYYATRTIGADKSERIVLIAPRPIQSFESPMKSGMSTYPFSVIELRLGPDGQGTGSVILGAQLKDDLSPIADRVVQNVRLTRARRVPVKHPSPDR